MPEISTIHLENLWTAGLNKSTPEAKLPLEFSPWAVNVMFDGFGGVRTRPGFVPWKGNPGTGSLFVLLVDKAGQSWSQYHVFSVDAIDLDWIDESASTFTNETVAFGASAFGDAAAYDGTAYFVGQSKQYKFDTGTLTLMTQAVPDGSSGTMIGAEHLEWNNDRMWAVDVRYTNGQVFRNRIHFSNIADPETWDAGDYIDLPDDGQAVKLIKKFGDDLLIFKEDIIWVLVGKTKDTFELIRLSTNLGTVQTLKNETYVVGDKLFFIASNNRLSYYDGAGFGDVDDALHQWLYESDVLEPIYRRTWDGNLALVNERYLLRGIYETDNAAVANHYTAVFDTKTGLWALWQHEDWGESGYLGASVNLPYSEAGYTLFYNLRTSAYLMRLSMWEYDEVFPFYESDSLGGGAIPDFRGTYKSRVRTGWITPESPANPSRLYGVDVVLGVSKYVSDVTVNIFTDYDPNTVVYSETVTASESIPTFHELRDFDATRFNAVQIEFLCDDPDLGYPGNGDAYNTGVMKVEDVWVHTQTIQRRGGGRRGS
jgi:hypothetical protein